MMMTTEISNNSPVEGEYAARVRSLFTGRTGRGGPWSSCLLSFRRSFWIFFFFFACSFREL